MKDTERISDLILVNNQQFIVFNKPPTMPVQPDPTQDTSLHQLAEIYCKHPVKMVHRLDRPSSGITVMAKNKHAAMDLSKQWKHRDIVKHYLAVVPAKGKIREGRWEHLLHHNRKKNKSYVVDHKDDGAKEAVMEVKFLTDIDNYKLLEVRLYTGRHHQIRVQLGHQGFPIKGDVKYGARRKNRDRSIHLHAWKLALTHPISNEKVEIQAPPPTEDNVWKAFDAAIPEQDLFLTRTFI